MTPRDAYIRMRPWARRLIDRGIGSMLLPAFALLLLPLLLIQMLALCRDAAIRLYEICAELPRAIADDWRTLRLAIRYRRNAEPGDPNG